MKKARYPILILSVFHWAAAFSAGEQWIQSYDAGYFDDNGRYAGGSEIMHVVGHKGRLFAANGYWVDARWEIPPDAGKQSAQVIRLDSAGGRWQVDLDMGESNGLGLRYMKGNILKSVTFSFGAEGRRLEEPVNLLVMAAGASLNRGGAVSVWVRDDSEGQWAHTLVKHGSNAGGVRWVPRDLEVYRDRVTGIERLFLSLGNPGIITGVYDPSLPGKIRWERHTEYPFPLEGTLRTRPLGIVQANGALFFSAGGSIYQRVDGARPTYKEIHRLAVETDADVGGVRGLTAVANPNGEGESLLFVWAPGERAKGQIKRLDPDGSGGYTMQDEANLAELMGGALGVPIRYILGAHNMMYPFVHPGTGETVHIIGFQGNLGAKESLQWKPTRLYGGAMYAVRDADGKYTVHEVNNAYKPGKPFLVSPRTFCLSPFGDGHLYVGGHDSSNSVSDDMAWIFQAPLEGALGMTPAEDAAISVAKTPRIDGVDEGPVYELRIYIANEGRYSHLLKRFREHTDRLFKKHGMKPLGYWSPVEGTEREQRTFYYILEHPSRYEAYVNWNRFTRDREWQAVLEQPEFQRLLNEKPESIFMTKNDYAKGLKAGPGEDGATYELRTCVANPGKLNALNARFRDHAVRIFRRLGMESVAYWTPFDKPESENTLIYLIRHANREMAEANWESFGKDPDWQKVARESEADGKLLARPPGRVFLRAEDFSPPE